MGSATIKIHSKNLTASRLRRVFENDALPILSEQILTDCNTYVRKQSGVLEGSAHKEAGGKYIVWNGPYAKRVYYTGTPLKNRNPLASLRWCEVAKRNYSSDWAAMATKLVKGR